MYQYLAMFLLRAYFNCDSAVKTNVGLPNFLIRCIFFLYFWHVVPFNLSFIRDCQHHNGRGRGVHNHFWTNTNNVHLPGGFSCLWIRLHQVTRRGKGPGNLVFPNSLPSLGTHTLSLGSTVAHCCPLSISLDAALLQSHPISLFFLQTCSSYSYITITLNIIK